MLLLKPGNVIPKFSLPNQDGILVNSSSFLGKYILIYFYPKAMTPGCTKQACALRDHINTFKKLNIEIVGISSDKPKKLYLFSEKEMLNFTLLSDQYQKTANQFGVWGEKTFIGKKYYGIYRITFFVNQKNIIEKVFTNFTPENHIQTVLQYLQTK